MKYVLFLDRSSNMQLTDDMLREALIKVTTEEFEVLEEQLKDYPPVEFSEEYKRKIKTLLE